MEKISEMIERLCPEGVERVRLGDNCNVLRGKRLTKSQLEENGKYPVLHGGATPMGYYSEYNRKANTTVVVNTGNAGSVFFYDSEFWSSDACFAIYPNSKFDDKYLYLCVYGCEKELKNKIRAGAMPTIDALAVENLRIPLPPLAIQQEIVRILDSFTSMITNLETELASRQKQYEHYRNKLLTFDENDESVEWKTLGDVCLVTKLAGYEFTEHVTYSDKGNIIALRGLNVKNGKLDLSDVKFIDDSNFSKLNRSKLFVGDMLFTYVGTVGQVALVNENDKFYLAPNVALVRINAKGKLMPDYLNYVCQSDSFQTKEINKFCASSSMKNISMANIRKMSIPIPSLERQQEIVSTLDDFESLITNIKQELEARKKQYEYYREQLLTFRPSPALP